MSLPPGTTLAHFQIVAPLGAGGMGEVYRAQDSRLGREVAIKVLPASVSADRELLFRFAHEARSASALNHPNIVTIYEVGQVDATPYIAMELIDGTTLRVLLADPLPLRKVLQWGGQLADGLAKAHSAGIVHRDLKPENVMVTKDGYVKILDFGLAKLTGPFAKDGSFAQGLTGTGLVVGTAGYMSPEQAGGKVLDFRSDQFALGLILYEMVTGQRAFQKASVVQTLSAIIQDEPEPIQTHNPNAPSPLCWLIERCLAKEPEERYASTQDLSRDLRNLRNHLSVGGVPTSISGPLTPAAPMRSAKNAVPSGAEAPTLVGRTPTAATRAMADAAVTRAEKAVAAPPAAPRARAGSIAVATLVGLLLLALGAGGGVWFDRMQLGPSAPEWSGEILLGGSTRAFSPRISPDGQTLAFLTPVKGVLQVSVMKPGSGDWIVLTRRVDLGSVNRLAWSRDGATLLYDRVTEVPRGVFQIPAIGGEERMVLEDAQSPEPLPDGALLVARVDADRQLQLARFSPNTGKAVAIGPKLVRDSGVQVLAFPDGKEALLYARLAAGSDEKTSLPRPYLLDLATGRQRPFLPDVLISPPFAVTPDGRSVLADIVRGDLHQILSISRDGRDVKVLMSLPMRPRALNPAADGSLYIGLLQEPVELLRFPTTGGTPERLNASSRNIFMHPVELPDGRLLMPSQVAGMRRLLAALPGEPLRPFAGTTEQTMPPAVLLGKDRVAFWGGGSTKELPMLVIASTADGRILKRFEETRNVLSRSLAATPDGKTLFFIDSGTLHSIDTETGVRTKLRPANGVAVDPGGTTLVVQLNTRDGVRMTKVDRATGTETAVPFYNDLQLSVDPIAGNALGPDGRLVVSVSSKDSWFTGPALLTLANGFVERVPVRYDGDVRPTTWGKDGGLLGMGVAVRSELWRFRPAAAQQP